MTPRRKIIAAAVALLLACTPTEPCACPPARTSLIVYGAVRTAAGAPAGGATVRYTLAPPADGPTSQPQCEFEQTLGDVEPDSTWTDAEGRFRSVVYSGWGPSIRCLRVTARAAGTNPDSARIDGLLVPFKLEQPDSVGLVLTLR